MVRTHSSAVPVVAGTLHLVHTILQQDNHPHTDQAEARRGFDHHPGEDTARPSSRLRWVDYSGHDDLLDGSIENVAAGLEC